MEPQPKRPWTLRLARLLLRVSISTFVTVLMLALVLAVFPILAVPDLAAAGRIGGFVFTMYLLLYGLRSAHDRRRRRRAY